MKHQQDQRGNDNQEQVIARQLAAEHFDRPTQTRGAWTQQILRTPQPERGVIDHQHQREGREQLKKLGSAIDPPQQQDLNQRTDNADNKSRRDYAPQEPQPTAARSPDRVGNEGPDQKRG